MDLSPQLPVATPASRASAVATVATTASAQPSWHAKTL